METLTTAISQLRPVELLILVTTASSAGGRRVADPVFGAAAVES
jgi:hypothetical protein